MTELSEETKKTLFQGITISFSNQTVQTVATILLTNGLIETVDRRQIFMSALQFRVQDVTPDGGPKPWDTKRADSDKPACGWRQGCISYIDDRHGDSRSSMNATMPSVRFNATRQTAASPVFHSHGKCGFGPKRNTSETAFLFHNKSYPICCCRSYLVMRQLGQLEMRQSRLSTHWSKPTLGA
ncbi:hypothetical protein, partial [Rhizobium mesoamericanum]|uniref:hypothetical protein n=1 Tax=Rhizobium mesoamericanum TaxID=1079800 RepID=UPI0027D851B6